MSPKTADALVMRRVVNLAKQAGFFKIIVNSDCLSVVNQVNAAQVDAGTYYPRHQALCLALLDMSIEF